MLPTAYRLTDADLFRRVSRRGRRAAGAALVVHVLPGEGSGEGARGPRVGFVVSKAVGGAVVRNRVRRRLRHATASLLASLGPGDLVVVRALPPAATLGYQALETDLVEALHRSGGLDESRGVA